MRQRRTILGFLAAAVLAGWESVPAQDARVHDEVSYTNDIQPLVRNFCTTCHAGEDPSGDLLLETYEQVRRQTEKGDLLKRINDVEDPMPQKGLLPLPMRRLFQKWADGGYVRAGRKKKAEAARYQRFQPPVIRSLDVSKAPTEFLERMQGHWVGSMRLMGQDIDWFSFDYRAIAPSHVHGIFEGGTMGNLFTSFFLAEFRGTKTIMARNGGLLNGIYRTSYFVLTEAKRGSEGVRYRFVDAYGGKGIMWMDIRFRADSIEFVSYTSRMGVLTPPTEHMRFQGRKRRPELSRAAARAVGFPKATVERRFPDGLPKPDWGSEYPVTSASYLWEDKSKSVREMARLSGDPYRIDQVPHVAQLSVDIARESAAGKKLFVFLSTKALVDENGRFLAEGGYVRAELLDTLTSFPELSTKQSKFTFTYLHPGAYFLTVVADMDGDGLPSTGDITHRRVAVTVRPRSKQTVKVRLDVRG